MDEKKVREAIELIKQEIHVLEKLVNYGGIIEEKKKKHIGLYNTAIEALEKQLPKKGINITMNVLEKILEKNEMEAIKELTEENERCFNQCEGDCSSTKNGICNCNDGALVQAIQKIRSYLENTNNENDDWIPADSDNQPKDGERVLVSFENFNEVLTARYKAEEEGGTFLLDADDTDESFVSHDLYVSAWQPLPDRYKGE